MARLDDDNEVIPYGLTARQKSWAEKYRLLRLVWGEAAKGLTVQACKAAGYQGNENSIAVEASNLKKHPRVRAYLESMDEVSNALADYPILTDDEMMRLASKEAQTAKSDASRVRALEVLQKLKPEKGERESEMSMEELVAQASGGDPRKEALVRELFDIEDDAA